MGYQIAIFGSTGQLGGTLLRHVPDTIEGSVVLGGPRSLVDLEDSSKIVTFLEKARPEIVINAAACRSVDQAEAQPEQAFSVSARAPAVIAKWCARRDGGKGIPFVHFSSDYVFRGDSESPLRETDSCGPVNVYGRSKLAAEQAVAEAGGRFLIRALGIGLDCLLGRMKLRKSSFEA